MHLLHPWWHFFRREPCSPVKKLRIVPLIISLCLCCSKPWIHYCGQNVIWYFKLLSIIVNICCCGPPNDNVRLCNQWLGWNMCRGQIQSGMQELTRPSFRIPKNADCHWCLDLSLFHPCKVHVFHEFPCKIPYEMSKNKWRDVTKVIFVTFVSTILRQVLACPSNYGWYRLVMHTVSHQ